jgi:hypothetical protein
MDLRYGWTYGTANMGRPSPNAAAHGGFRPEAASQRPWKRRVPVAASVSGGATGL